MSDFDLIVIGAGPAGEKGAAQAAYFKKKVAIVEREPVVGGACVNTGTVPSKTLREAAIQLTGFKQREVYGVDIALKNNVTIADLMARKQQVIDKEWRMIEKNLDRHRVARYHGDARMVSDHEVQIDRRDGSSDRISGAVILIATGSSPNRPASIPFDDEFVYDSDSILKLDRIPESMAVVGAGVIGCEYASIFASLGTRVSLVDGRTSLLPHIDREIAKQLLSRFQTQLGIDLYLGSPVKTISRKDSGISVALENGFAIEAEKCLFAAGRISNTATLNLEGVGVTLGKNGVVIVNENYQTSVPNIYAAGDVIGFPALASTSMEQARVAMVHAFDLKYKTKVATLLPYAIYTIPELAAIGLTEQDCREKKIDVELGRAYYRNNARGQIIGDDAGMIKLVFDPNTLKLYGVHVIGENASEILHVGMVTMHYEGTINAFIECVFNFPTLGEAYKYAAYDGLGNVARRQQVAEGARL